MNSANKTQVPALFLGLLLGFRGFSGFDDLFRLSRRTDQQIAQEVDEPRKRPSELVGVVGTVVKRAFVHGVIADDSARLGKRTIWLGNLEAFDLLCKRLIFSCAEMDSQPVKRKPEHGACAARRLSDDCLRFVVSLSNFLGKVRGRQNARQIRPNHFAANPKVVAAARRAARSNNLINLMNRVREKTLFHQHIPSAMRTCEGF